MTNDKPMIDIEEINDIDELFRRREVWDSLLEQTRGALFFQTLDWLRVYWKHYGAGQKLRAIVVSSPDGPLGILPLVVRREGRRIGGVRVLTYPLEDWGSFYGPLGPQPAVTLAEGLRHVRRTRRDWDVIEMRWTAAGSDLDTATRDVMRQAGLQTYCKERDKTALVRLGETFEQCEQAWTSKHRNNLRRQQRRLAKSGELKCVTHRPAGAAAGDADPRWDLYDACTDIARRSWQGSSQTGTTITHETVRDFLREMHGVASAAGGVAMNMMFLDGQPLAFAYNYHWRGYNFGLRIGYDAALSRDGVGNVLTVNSIKSACQHGDHTYDMGPGSLEYKRYFATDIVPILQYNHYHTLAARAQVLRLKHCAQQWWSPAASAMPS
jgi:CelD/BcsL family acetyltransferase involved in cellulose biosynthesis